MNGENVSQSYCARGFVGNRRVRRPVRCLFAGDAACGPRRAAVVLAAALGLALVAASAKAALVDTFDPANPAVTSTKMNLGDPAEVISGPVSGNFLRLIHDGQNDQRNHYSYDRTDVGAYSTISATFDFAGYSADQPADGLAVLWVPTSIYGTTGMGPDSYDTPNFAGTFALGFHTYPTTTNSVSVHWNSTTLSTGNVPLDPVANPTKYASFRNGEFNRVQVDIQQIGNGSNVKVQVTGDYYGVSGGPRTTVTALNQYVSGFLPYESRMQFSGRSGGSDMTINLDNINVTYANAPLALPTVSPNTLYQDFDSLGTTQFAAVQGNANSTPGPLVYSGGPTGNFLRLMDRTVGSQTNRIAFDRAFDGGVSNSLKATYDFRINPSGNPGDGYSIVLLPTSTYADKGVGASYTAEEPNVAGVFGVGFDLYPVLNNVSLHWNGAEVTEVAVPTGSINLDASVFHRAEIIARYVPGGSNVTVTLTPNIYGTPGTPVTVFSDYFVPGMKPFDYRAQFAARSGGATLDVDLDNITSGVAPLALVGTDTVQDFDGGGTQYKAYSYNKGSHPQLVAGATGDGLRLLFSQNDQQNVIGFDRTAPGIYGHVTASFDMKIGSGADGAGFALLNTANYGTTGAPPSLGAWEEPSLTNSFGMGFDVYNDIHEVSLHWNNGTAANTTSAFDFRDNLFHQVDLDIDFVVGGAYVTASIAGNPLYTNQWIAGMTPYEARLAFGGRTGGVNTTLDVDNFHVAWSNDTAVWAGGTGSYTDNTQWVGNSGPSSADNAVIGSGQANSGGMVVEDPGTVTVQGTGFLNISGGLEVAKATGSTGTFIQTGGQVTTTGDFYVANDAPPTGVANATGYYNMSGGTLTVGGWHTVIGRFGQGHFTQSGDAIVNLRRLFLAEFTNSAGSTYTLNGGTLNLSQRMEVGRNYAATFTQTGGTVNAMSLEASPDDFSILVGRGSNAGVYNLQGGTLNVNVLRKGTNGQFNFTGGRLNARTIDFSLTNAGGTLAPGNSPGLTTINGNYVQLAGGTYEVNIDGLSPGTGYDQLTVNGQVTLDGALDVLLGFAPPLGQDFVIISNDGTTDPVQGQFAGLPEGSLVWADFLGADYAFRLTYQGLDGNDVVLSSVPEPATWTLLAVGLVGLAAFGRRLRARGRHAID